MKNRFRSWGIAFALICSPTLVSQVDRATLAVVVLDTSSAIVPGAALELRSLDTGLTRSAVTDANGGYRFAGLPVGAYDVAVRHAGFKEVRVQSVRLQVAQIKNLDLTL